MVVITPKYTIKQKETFLKQPFNSNFGISLDKAISYFWAHPPNYLIRPQGENLTHANFPKYIDRERQILGKNSYVIFICILIEENATMGWINHTPRGGTPMQDLVADCNYIQSVLHGKYPVAQSDPYGGIPSMPWSAIQACSKFYASLPVATIGRYYIPSTLAGNARTWAPSWSNSYYFGDAYANIIDHIKRMGGNPFNGGSSGGGDSDQQVGDVVNLPKAVYLNNSKFEVLGVKFRRYGNWLYIDYPDFLNVANGGGTSSPSGTGTNSEAVKKALAVFDTIKGKYYTYSMARPAGNPNRLGWADCSGMVGWILHTAYPKAWNNGSLNTGTLLAYFKKKVIWKGTLKGFASSGAYKKVKAGDIVIFGVEPTCGAGGNSHTAFIYDDNGATISQEPPKTIYSNIHNLCTNWWTARPYFYHIRI